MVPAGGLVVTALLPPTSGLPLHSSHSLLRVCWETTSALGGPPYCLPLLFTASLVLGDHIPVTLLSITDQYVGPEVYNFEHFETNPSYCTPRMPLEKDL